MNLSELLESYFGGANAERLGREAGLGAAEAEQVLRQGLPLQLRALADQASTPEGQAQIAEAVRSLPAFASVEAALAEPEGAAHLQQAGELLAPALLGEQADSIAAQVAGNLKAGSVQRLLHMALPLLLSLLGQRGISVENLGSLLPGRPTGTEVTGGALTAAGLVEFLRGQMAPTAEQIGRTAGFTGGTATRAAQAALPVVLGALATRGQTEAGAADLLKRGATFDRLTDAGGLLNPAPLGDAAEAARVEGQGRGLLEFLFPNVNAVTGRFGSALGGSGANAGRLLALTAPLVLALLAGRARAGNLKAADLSRLLAGVGPLLPALLPPGLTSLNALLTPPQVQPPVPRVEAVAVAEPPAPRVEKAPPVTPTAPRPAEPVPPAPPARRGGFPWWLIPLLLLLGLGAWWFLRQPTATTAVTTVPGAPGSTIVVTNPTSGASLPAEDFVMSGTAPAGDTLGIEDQGQQVASVNVGTDGKWQAAIPAPTPGEHTYTVSGKNSGARSEFKVNVAGAAGTSGANTSGSGTSGGNTNGAFTITEPAAKAQLPAGGFTLRGTGTPGQTVQVLEDGTSLGNVTVGDDGTWSLNVPSPAAGPHTYMVQGPDGSTLGSVTATIAAPSANASAANCTQAYTLSITDGQTVSEPFRFGGVGQGQGYRVTVKRGDHVIGTRNVPLDATCGWSYQSRPGAGTVTYEVRPLGNAATAPLGTVTLTVTR